VDTHGEALDAWFPHLGLGPLPDPPPQLVGWTLAIDPRSLGGDVVTVEIDTDAPPATVPDAYLRLHLLSNRLVLPRTINLDGIFGLLPINAWTNLGPIQPERVDEVRATLMPKGQRVEVHGLDRFPRMTDYVTPPGVRIADVDRVRLGAHLASGTTVMHEGFVNFNAGTLGTSMVEGRISGGVIVGDGSDIGGGASILGTLSGGGKEQVTIGERCLLGANGGIGISLGDDCVVEAGLYVTASTPVLTPDGVVKARELSGQDNLMFIRDGQSGKVVVRARTGAWGTLNADLHVKQ